MSEIIVKKIAFLRGQGRFEEAVKYAENTRDDWDEDSRIPALLQAFYAAEEGSLGPEAARLAKEIAEEDPNVPSVQKYLERGK